MLGLVNVIPKPLGLVNVVLQMVLLEISRLKDISKRQGTNPTFDHIDDRIDVCLRAQTRRLTPFLSPARKEERKKVVSKS